MSESEPPSSNQTIFLIGRNSRGQWVAQARNGLYGGLFISRAAAVSYAMFESGHNPASIVATPETLELEVAGLQPTSAPQSHSAIDAGEPVRRAA
ncbi:MAG: hypothetical protein P4M07_22940 [Xanthobacteraceae bacterium]|nr:hypothetical protein [Xanthobacteraceae bacterium]